MHTGQNSIAPENSLPQLGQFRWNTVFMDLTAPKPQFEPKSRARSTEWCKISLHGPLQSCCPSSQTLVYSFIVGRQIKFRNKTHTLGDLPPPVAEGIFDRDPAVAGDESQIASYLRLTMTKHPTSAFIASMRFLADSESFAKQWFGFRRLTTANL
jgi:hypothetical protein